MSAIKVGDTIWRFDENRRKYDKPGIGGSVIYAEHFIPETITGATPGCWIVGEGRLKAKVNKKTLRTAAGRYGATRYFTDEGKSEDIWSRSHRLRVIRLVETCDVSVLRQIADLVGYKPDGDA